MAWLNSMFLWLGTTTGLLEDLSPSINAWIAAKVPAEKQHIFDRRMRRCKRLCRKGKFTRALVAEQVATDFQDEPDLQADISNLICADLNITK